MPEYGAVDLILDGNTAYVSAPFLKTFLPAGKTWLKLDGKTRSSALPKSIPQNPKQALARLKKLANVRKVGEETIDGVTTTHYHGVGRARHGTFDVWIGNDDGYVRRVQRRRSERQARARRGSSSRSRTSASPFPSLRRRRRRPRTRKR